MELKPYLRALRRGLLAIVVVMVIGALAGWFTGSESPNSPTADRFYVATSLLVYSGNQLGGVEDPSSYGLEQVALYATTGKVPQAVAKKLGTSPVALARQVATYTDKSTNTIGIVGISQDPEYAVEIAETTTRVLLDSLNNITDVGKEGTLRKLDEQRKSLEQQIAELQNTVDTSPDPAAVADAKASLTAAATRLEIVKNRIDATTYSGIALGLTQIQESYAARVSEAAFNGWSRYAVGGMRALPEQNRNNEGNPDGAPVFAPIQEPVSRQTRAAIGALVGLVAAAGVVLALFRLDDRLRSKYEVEDAFGVDVIAEIPPLTRAEQKGTQVASLADPRGTFAEAYRSLRTSVEFVGGSERAMRLSHVDVSLADESDPDVSVSNGNGAAPNPDSKSSAQVILVTSALPAEGKTVTVSNLAAVLAESGASVLVVNCDYRRPQIANYLIPVDGATRRTRATTDGRPVVRSSIVPGVKLVTGIGEQDISANPTEVALLQRRVIELARPRFDYILLDTAPMLTTNDATEILPETDLAILVCRSGKTTRDSAERLSELLRRFGAPVLGVVLTDSIEAPGAKYSYYYHEMSNSPQTPVPPVDSVSLEL